MNIFLLLIPLFLYITIYSTPLRYRGIWKYVTYHKHWTIVERRIYLSFNLRREYYFGLGFTYNFDLNHRFEYEDTYFNEERRYTLHLCRIYITLHTHNPHYEYHAKNYNGA